MSRKNRDIHNFLDVSSLEIVRLCEPQQHCSFHFLNLRYKNITQKLLDIRVINLSFKTSISYSGSIRRQIASEQKQIK